jgi:hypothetical protein
MITELIAHAERVLRHTPGGTLPAHDLHGAVAREAGTGGPLQRFVADLRGHPDRFTVFDRLPLADGPGWEEAERAAYAAALRGSPLPDGPFVALTDPAPADDAAGVQEPSSRPAGCGGVRGTRYGVVAEALQEGLAELMRAAGEDAGLRLSVGGAIAELQAAYTADVRERAPA